MNLAEYETTRRHRALGVTSFVVSLVATVILFGAFGAGAYFKVTGEVTRGQNLLVGLGVFFAGFLELVAIGLGIAGIFEKSSKKAFPIAGLAIAFSTLLITIAVIAIGVAKMRGELP